MKIWLPLPVALGFLTFATTASAQPASLGKPVAAAALGVPDALARPASSTTVRGASPDPLFGDYSPGARLGPISEARLGPSSSGPILDNPDERYNWGLTDPSIPSRRSSYSSPTSSKSSSRRSSKFGDKMGEFADNGGNTWGNFESDHCFDDFISPTSNPFLAEDPRSLTEIRPIFMYQSIPSSNPYYHGGNLEWFGLQGRLALTQRFSLVLHKLGGLTINPGSDSGLSNSTGFAEIWLGPKYTWYRDDQTGTIIAGGLQFQIATGNSSTFQNTGSLSFVPYLTGAQKFGKTSWGTFTVMDTLGYAIRSNSQRSPYFYNSIHLDYDVANWGRFYPFLEMNWFHYTRNGSANPVGFEGTDIANVGAAVAGTNYLGLAVGARYKFSESLQMGLAAEFPLVGGRTLSSFRLGVDLIWRY